MAQKTPDKTDGKPLDLRATPEVEDFNHKYTEEGSKAHYGLLINNYFRRVEQLVAASGVSGIKGAGAIEIGCGEGYSTQRLAKIVPSNVMLEASEFVPALVPKARANNPGMTVTEESIYDLKHANNSFDLVFLLEVLEHLDYPDKGLEELLRITKPGGYLVLGVPREPLWRALNMARLTYLKDFGNTPGHLNHWSTRGVKKFVGSHFGPIVDSKTPLPWSLVLARKPEA